jgi:3-hydroxyacyl-CoA dehydrogenase/enoyl-CoA hydratase/3-hydroxybutyryl-CoA epimerase
VEKMPLLEVIATEQTEAEVIATVAEFGRAQGKTVIVVKDGAGFYVNRILAPYINEAGTLLESGVAIDQIDQALVQFGFPVGPFALLDEVGIDVGSKVAPILHEAFGERMKPAKAAQLLVREGRLGKKSKRGFYIYDAKDNTLAKLRNAGVLEKIRAAGKLENIKKLGSLETYKELKNKNKPQVKKTQKQVDVSVYKLLGVTPDAAMDDSEISERCVLLMLNEAARCLAEDVIRSPRDGDIGAIFGIGFPPFLGGPFRYMDSLGIAEIVDKLQDYQQRLGERFAPAGILLEMAEQNKTFYPEKTDR